MQAAIEVISQKGVEKTSISDIVKQAGVAQGTFYLYFSSKNALIPAIADHLLTKLFNEIKHRSQPLADFREKVQLIIDVTFEMTEAYKEVLILCYAGLAFEHSFEKWEGIYRPYYQWLEAEMNKAKENGEISADIRIETTVRMVVSVIEQTAEGLYFSHADEKESRTLQLKKDVFTFINKALS